MTFSRIHGRLLLSVGVISLFFVFACSPERKLAKQFLKTHKGEGILLSPAYMVYKVNHSANIDLKALPDQDMQDSVAFFSSEFMQFVSDSVFLSIFTNAFIEKLYELGYQVTLENETDLFLAGSKPAWVLALAQLQLEEDYSTSPVYGYDDDDEEYILYYQVNMVSLNTWVEVNPVNTASGSRQLLFMSGFIEDEKDANVSLDYYKGQFYLNDFRIKISLDEIYKMANVSGEKLAYMLFDYFLNDYIRRNMKSTASPRKEMHYNKVFGTIETGLNERLEVIE